MPLTSPRTTGAPAPASLLGLRATSRFLRDPLRFLQRTVERQGDVADIRLAGARWVLLSHPDDIEEVLVGHAADVKRDSFAYVLRRALGEGLLTSDGELWKRQRRLMSTAFTPKRIRGYAGAMAQVTERGAARLRAGATVNLHEEMSRLTMEVVADVLFGASVAETDVATVRESMEVFNAYFASSPEVVLGIPTWVPTARHRAFRRALASMDAIIFRILDARRRGEERDDLLGALLAARDDDGSAMDDRQLRDETLTLFVAGHETTALALTHALYLLAKHPDVERRLHAEVDARLGGRLPTHEDVPALGLAERIVKEAMRLYPPVWMTGREPTAPFEVAGRQVGPGMQLVMSEWIVHRDPRWWPAPEVFDPDRFLPEVQKTRPRFAYFPFGGGPRICIGNHFAMMEAVLMLAVLAQRFRFELLPFETLTFSPSVTLRPKGHGLRVKLHARRPAPAATVVDVPRA